MSGILEQMEQIIDDHVHNPETSRAIVHSLIKKLGGGELYIPAKDLTFRNLEIKKMHRAGASVRDLAKRNKLTEKTIYRILES